MLETAIQNVLSQDVQTKKFFLGVFARDELPKSPPYPSCFVFNTAPREHKGQHWLGVFYDKNGICDFFDSYGIPAANFNIENYLDETSKSWNQNKKRIQGDSLFCGHYVILFLLFRARGKSKCFFQAFTASFSKNDKLIKDLFLDI